MYRLGHDLDPGVGELDPARHPSGVALSIEERWLPIVEMYGVQLRERLRRLYEEGE
jgi:hypothetical protein